jgi:protein-tyrosine phosphatase
LHNLTELPFNLTGKIYRSPLPFGTFDVGHTAFQEFIDNEISVVFMLMEDEEVKRKTEKDISKLYHNAGIKLIQFPIEDFNVPSDNGTLKEILFNALQLARAGHKIVVHCNAGWGRTGIFISLLARMILDLPPEEAIQWIRQFVPQAVENAEQYQYVVDFEL